MLFMTLRYVAAPLFALSLSACSAEVERKAPPVNPSPNRPYAVEFWAESPPRPMSILRAVANYGVEDDGCLPKVPISGVNAVSGRLSLPAQIDASGGEHYRVSAFQDAWLPTDAYGLGACVWSMTDIEMFWSDGAIAYRIAAHVVDNENDLAAGEHFVMFPRDSRGWMEPGVDQPLAYPVLFGNYKGRFPEGYVDDTSSPYFKPRTIDERVPTRAVSTKTDFIFRFRTPATMEDRLPMRNDQP